MGYTCSVRLNGARAEERALLRVILGIPRSHRSRVIKAALKELHERAASEVPGFRPLDDHELEAALAHQRGRRQPSLRPPQAPRSWSRAVPPAEGVAADPPAAAVSLPPSASAVQPADERAAAEAAIDRLGRLLSR